MGLLAFLIIQIKKIRANEMMMKMYGLMMQTVRTTTIALRRPLVTMIKQVGINMSVI